jgi:hypothetical protein
MRQPGGRATRSGAIPADHRRAEETAILDVMRRWPDRMEKALRDNGIDGFLAGDDIWRIKFEDELERPRDPEIYAEIAWLAEQGHSSARAALIRFATPFVEGTGGRKFDDLPASVKSFVSKALNNIAPAHLTDQSRNLPLHPQNHRGGDFIRNLPRDISVSVMTSEAFRRWKLPRYKSSNKHRSAAWFVALVMSERGSRLGESHVERICASYRKGLARRMLEFFVFGAPLP